METVFLYALANIDYHLKNLFCKNPILKLLLPSVRLVHNNGM